MLRNNLLATTITLVLALLWLRLVDYIAHRGYISGKLSRKIIHIGTGPIFVLCWFLFDDSSSARYLAALIPFAITIQFALIGLGIWKDPASVDAMTRTGDRREILRGPLIYGIVFVLVTIIFWKSEITGIVALMILCGGDGFADIIGKSVPSGKIPWSKGKTWAGSLAMFFGSILLVVSVIFCFARSGIIGIDWASFIPNTLIICFICTIIESLPIKDFDNITVPLTAILLGHLLF